jgi:3-methyladenine DNA glycosylase AlkD
MTVKEIMIDLEAHGSESVKRIWVKHGYKEPFFGVKIAHLKTIQKKIKKDYQLAKDLYATGNADAMYLAGLIADDEKMSKTDLQTWIKAAVSNSICESIVPWVATMGRYGHELALEWIDSKEERIAAAGWATLAGLVSVKPDSELDLAELKKLMTRVAKTIHAADNRVRYWMNSFIICVGAYVVPLTDDAIAAAKKIGMVSVDMNGTACTVPDALTYIGKVAARGPLGKKKKTVKC